MKKLLTAFTLIFLMLSVASSQESSRHDRHVFMLEISGVIGPATADYFERSVDKASQMNPEFILLKMDTPGGLDVSMRKIIKKIIASPIPIVTYVTPGGARAASAGTYILYASHIAAMSPGTNLGAATPVQLMPDMAADKTETQTEEEGDKQKKLNKAPVIKEDDAMANKMMNDAVAYIQSLAKMRGRNEKWAEKAVTEAASLPAEEALKQRVIDIVANNTKDLFEQLNGKSIAVQGREQTITTTGISIKEILPDWRNKFLQTITNPNIAYILMLVGIYGLIFEFSSPGAILPGTVGAISLLLALFAFQVLPINYAGLALIALGVALMVAEAFQPSFGVLGIGGVISFATGSVILIDTDLPGYGIDIGIIAGFTVSTVAFFLIALGMVFRNRRNPIISGHEQMIGAGCVAVEDFEQKGRVRVHSEIWQASSEKPMKKGQHGEVEDIEGLVVKVKAKDN